MLLVGSPVVAQVGVWRGPFDNAEWPGFDPGFLPDPASPYDPLPGEVIGCWFTIDPDSWRFWWGANQEGMLHAARSRAPLAEVAELKKDWRERVEERLVECLRDEAAVVREAAAMALARVTSSPGGFHELRFLLEDPAPDVGDVACLALGVLQDIRAIPLLWRILVGQAEEGSAEPSRIPNSRRRLHAALGLSLLARGPLPQPVRNSVALELLRAATDPGNPEDLRVACLVGLGAVPVADASAFAPPLLRILADPRQPVAVRALCSAALSKLTLSARDPAASEAVVRGLLAMTDEVTGEERIEASIFLALGRLAARCGSFERELVVDACLAVVEGSGPAFLIGAALLALSEAASEAEVGDPVRQRAEDALVHFVSRGYHSIRPWAALALGRMAMLRFEAGGGGMEEELAGLLFRRIPREADPEVKGAIVLALGMGRAPGAAPAIGRLMVKRLDPTLRGHCALALALLGNAAEAEEMHQVARSYHFRPTYRIHLPLSLAGASLGCPQLGEQLLRYMEGGDFRRDWRKWAAAAQALGMLRTPSSVPRLLEALAGESVRSPVPRAYAAGALGLILGGRGEAWAVPLLDGVDHRVLPSELLDPWRHAGALQRL